MSWESIADYTDVNPGAADRALATMNAVVKSMQLCRQVDEETVKKAVKAGDQAADQARASGADDLTVTRIYAATVCDFLSLRSTE